MNDLYISVDIETSGPRIGLDSMLQIGACLVGDIGKSYSRLLQPISAHADAKAMEVVRKPLSYFAEHGNDPITVITDFGVWVRSAAEGRTPIFVGFNAAFDWGFVNWYFLTCDEPNPFGFAPLDIKAYYAGLTGCFWEETRSSKIRRRFKVTLPHTHDALDDATEQAELFRLIMESR